MGQFGQDLRKEREDRGVALESVTLATKISSRHLLALEQEQFATLPGGVLNKGIVRGYARACGMDEDVWVGRYLSAYHGSGQVKDDDQSWIAFAENVGKARNGDGTESGQRLRWAGVAVLMGLLIFFTWYVLSFVETKSAYEAPSSLPASAHTADLETQVLHRSGWLSYAMTAATDAALRSLPNVDFDPLPSS